MLQLSNLAQKQPCGKIGGSQSIFNKTIETSDLQCFHRYDRNVNRKRVPSRSKANQDVVPKPKRTNTGGAKKGVEF